MLVPVTPSVSAIAKLEIEDPEAATELARLSVYEVFCALADKHGPRLQAIAKRAVDERTVNARRSLVRSYVSKRMAGEDVEDVLLTAVNLAYLDEYVSKAGKNSWDPRDHDRDENGRFKIMLSGDDTGARTDSMNAHVDAWSRQGIAPAGTPVNVHGRSMEYDSVDDDGNVVPGGDHPLRAVMGERGEGLKFQEAPPVDFDPRHLTVHPADIKPKPTAQSATLDLGRSFIGQGTKPMPGTGAGRFDHTRYEANLKQGYGSGPNGGYGQLQMAGAAVRQLSGPGSIGGAVGTVAQLIGELGPEAEKILSPGIRRIAYRYRGTEKTPDMELTREVENADELSEAVGTPEFEQLVAASGRRGARLPARGSPAPPEVARGLALGSAAYWHGQPEAQQWTEDQLALRVRGDAAAGYFIPKIPDMEKAKLSIASGRVPPSQGVIINSDGDVSSEAMGAGSDHYLPFDLKNLKELHGGSYVRTRVTGGPTAEDIYTGIMTGARQIQVASNSGIFTVEFDPSLRGGRRYSDKARNMVTRYQAILGRIKRSQDAFSAGGEGSVNDPKNAIYTQDIPPEEMSQIRQDALRSAGTNPKLVQDEIDEKVAAARIRGQYDVPTDEALSAKARSVVQAEVNSRKFSPASLQQFEQAVNDQFHTEQQAVRDKRITQLQLDGEGYLRALESLQEEFPYFIRSVDYEDLRRFATDRKIGPSGSAPRAGKPWAKDTGFVARQSVTATDHLNRHGEKKLTAEERHQEEVRVAAGGGQGGTGGGSGRTATGGSGVAVSTGIRGINSGFTPERGPKLSEITADLPVQLKAAMNPILEGNFNASEIAEINETAIGQQDEHANLVGGSPVTWLQVYSKGIGWTGAANKLVASGSPEQVQRAIDALDAAAKKNRQNSTQVADPDDPDTTLWSPEIAGMYSEAEKRLKQLLMVKSEPKDVSEIALHAPEGPVPVPAKVPAIEALNTKPSNFDGWLANVSSTPGSKVAEEIKAMSGMSSKQRADYVADKVNKYKKTVDWGNALAENEYAGKPGALIDGVTEKDDAKRIATQGERSQPYNDLQHTQVAWSFLHAKDRAATFSEGGGEAPKPPAASPPPPGQFGFNPRPETAAKRGRPRVAVVYQPGSPVAKAYAQVRRQRRVRV